MNQTAEKKWKEVITPVNHVFYFNWRELWEYRDLLMIMIRRDLLAIYKQTILGPLWFFLQPILTTLVFTMVFSRLARISTGNMPPVLFYLSGIVLWSYFSECLTRTSTFFRDNTQILTKVYFPRLIIPISLVLSNLIRFSIQLLVFFIVYSYFLIRGTDLSINGYVFLLPFLILLIAGLGLSLGMIISSLTTRYKDLVHLLSFGVQLLMFVSPVIFPIHNAAPGLYRNAILANPMTGIIEAFRYGFFGEGYFSWGLLAYDTGCIVFFLCVGIVVFNSVERSFADSI
jgi:lipopolysaccharide transport system permease protein